MSKIKTHPGQKWSVNVIGGTWERTVESVIYKDEHHKHIRFTDSSWMKEGELHDCGTLMPQPEGKIEIPVTWILDKGIELSVDDGRHFVDTMKDEDSFITSFAYRENTGKQPVDDWVPVIAGWFGYESGLKGVWKPDAKALYEMYLAEQNDKIPKETIKNTKGHKETSNDLGLMKMVNFIFSNKLMLPGESPFDCAIREVAEKHGIDIRTNEQKAINHMTHAYSKSESMEDVLAEIKKGYVAGVEWKKENKDG